MEPTPYEKLGDREREQIDHVFEYHAPNEKQAEAYKEIRAYAKDLAAVLMLRCPGSADRTAALRKLRETVMTANAAIALDGKSF